MTIKTNLTKNTSTKSKRVYHWMQLIFDAIIAFLCVWLRFIPMAKIGNVSMGTAMELVIECFKKEYESSQYLHFDFFAFAFMCIVIAVIRIIVIFMPIRLKMRLVAEGTLATNLLLWTVLIIPSFLGVFLCVNPLNEYYGCKIVTPYLLVALLFADVILLTLFRVINGLIDFRKKAKKYVSTEERVVGVVMTGIMTVISFGMAIALGISTLSILYPDGLIKDTRIVEVGDFIVEKTADYEFGTSVIHFNEGKIKKELVLDSSENEALGNNYFYYKCKIKELKDKMGQMWPEDGDWEEYAQNITQLEKNIEYLKNNTPKTYIKVELGEKKERWVKNDYSGKKEHQYGREIIGIEYNQNTKFKDEKGYKWGTINENPLSNLLYKEKILLSVAEFPKDTDFSTQEIIVEVHYTDGSVKISKIIAANYEDLNNAQTGKNILKWSDEWGEYEAEIIILV